MSKKSPATSTRSLLLLCMWRSFFFQVLNHFCSDSIDLIMCITSCDLNIRNRCTKYSKRYDSYSLYEWRTLLSNNRLARWCTLTHLIVIVHWRIHKLVSVQREILFLKQFFRCIFIENKKPCRKKKPFRESK